MHRFQAIGAPARVELRGSDQQALDGDCQSSRTSVFFWPSAMKQGIQTAARHTIFENEVILCDRIPQQASTDLHSTLRSLLFEAFLSESARHKLAGNAAVNPHALRSHM